MDVGADFFSAAELAELQLAGLPQRREHIARLASKQRWAHRERQGRGGGREFPLSALPADARADIIRRRMARESAKASGVEQKPLVPLPIIAGLKARQAETLAARSALLSAFDAFSARRKAQRGSGQRTLDLFVDAYANGGIDLAEWVRALIGATVSRRTLDSWLAARNSGRVEKLADNRAVNGRKSVFDQAPQLGEFVLGVHLKQPALARDEIAGLVWANFPEGVPDADNILRPVPSAAAIGRFLNKWSSDATNAQLVAAVNDPDRWRSKFRFAIGNASAGFDRVNQRWEIDASPADVLCSDGRHSIYVVVDVCSRRLLGMVSKTPRTVGSLLLIARACQAWGVPEEISTDNGSDFTSRHFVVALRQLGVRHHVVPPYQPQLKPFVERAIRTIQHKFMPLLDGYAGHNVAARSKIEARLSYAERQGEDDKTLLGATTFSGDMQDALLAWIANRYETRPHSGLAGRAPIEVWKEAEERKDLKWADPAAIGMLLMPPVRDQVRIITKKGVSVEGVDYFHPAMIVGQRVRVHLDPEDLGRVWVYTDTDPWKFIGVATNLDLEGVDRAEAAQRQKALQAEAMRQSRAVARRLIRMADLGSAGRRLIGETAPSSSSDGSSNVTWLNPALEEAARAARHRGARGSKPREIAPTSEEERVHLAALAEKFERQPTPEETGSERYARWKQLKAAQERGEEIPADQIGWLNTYPETGEWKFHRKVEAARRDE